MSRTGRWAEALRTAVTRLRRGRIVLLYHRIADAAPDPFRLSVSPRNFAEQLEVLRARTQVVPVAAMADRALRRGMEDSAAAITFDDGYADNLHVALPLLERADAPATVFVTTGSPGEEFWWDRLQRTLLTPDTLPEELELELGGQRVHWRLADLLTRRRRWTRVRVPVRGPRPAATGLLYRLQPLLRDMEAGPRQEALARLEAWADPPPSDISHRCMTADEVRRLGAGGLVEIGAHTATHPMLSRLSAERQLEEIRSSRQWLTSLLGRDTPGFAYPFGQPGEYSAASVRAVRDAGCAWACAAFPGFVGEDTDSYEIPRMWVEDWDGAQFARRLDDWLPRR